jgi:hypothetical protein
MKQNKNKIVRGRELPNGRELPKWFILHVIHHIV